MKIAVVGTGIAGNAAAYELTRQGVHEVIVYEKESRPGGHSHTVTVDYDGTPIPVDTGFIVYNELNYPGLTRLFNDLKVETLETQMTFSVSADEGRFEWKGGGDRWLDTAKGLFAQPANLCDPTYLMMLRSVLRFNTQSVKDRRDGILSGLSLGDYFILRGFPPRLLHDYLAPMGAAIWSTPTQKVLDFPAENFVAFFENHCLLQYQRPKWRSVKGGSRCYVEKLTAPFRRTMRIGTEVVAINRGRDGIEVRDHRGDCDTFDHVIVATHTDEALAMLTDATPHEEDVLGRIRFSTNIAYLHRDPRLMPKRRHAWAAWNFLRWPRHAHTLNDMAVTYWMNELQRIDNAYPVFVSLNPPFEPDPALTFGRYVYDHPLYDHAAFAAQEQLPLIQGHRNTWFCGAWTGYGFHEDGLRSGLQIARAIASLDENQFSSGTQSEAAE